MSSSHQSEFRVSLEPGGVGFRGARGKQSCLGCVVVLTLALLGAAWPAGAAPNPFLKTSGTNICNNYGQGDIVPLRGVNLGSWLVMESWMCPIDSSGAVTNDWQARNTLTNRFGAVSAVNLMSCYESVLGSQELRSAALLPLRGGKLLTVACILKAGLA